MERRLRGMLTGWLYGARGEKRQGILSEVEARRHEAEAEEMESRGDLVSKEEVVGGH